MQKAHLTISSYAGIVPGASHYMGRLRIGKEEVPVEYEITAAVAKTFNKEARSCGDDFRYRPGDVSSRFFDRESVVASAVEMMAEYPDTVLFDGSHCDLDPQPVLIGPEPFKTEANKLVAEAEANDWWEGDEEVMEDIFERWQKLLAFHQL